MNHVGRALVLLGLWASVSSCAWRRWDGEESARIDLITADDGELPEEVAAGIPVPNVPVNTVALREPDRIPSPSAARPTKIGVRGRSGAGASSRPRGRP